MQYEAESVSVQVEVPSKQHKMNLEGLVCGGSRGADNSDAAVGETATGAQRQLAVALRVTMLGGSRSNRSKQPGQS
jgi:hypothetical protein